MNLDYGKPQVKCSKVFQHTDLKKQRKENVDKLKETNTSSFLKWARLNCNVLDANLKRNTKKGLS